jgi:type III pantothenate kinase
MLLAIDIGNTSVHVGVFDGEALRATWRLGSEGNRLPDEYAVLLLTLLEIAGIERSAIVACSLSSSMPSLTHTFQEMIRRYFQTEPFIVAAGVETGIRILYENPRQVGPDRIVDAVAAIALYGPPLIVVDCGTFTVFDAISRDGDYLGGAIALGIDAAAEAINQRASRLYRVDLEPPASAIGRNTGQALQSGVMLGNVGLIEGLVARFQRELGGGAQVIGTGGYAEVIAHETPIFDAVNPELTLIGLRLLHARNCGGARQSPA